MSHPNFKVAVSQSVTKGRYRAARAAKITLLVYEICDIGNVTVGDSIRTFWD